MKHLDVIKNHPDEMYDLGRGISRIRLRLERDPNITYADEGK